MSSQDSSLLTLAKQGDARAIATLMNRHLNPKGINAKAVVKGGYLQVLLESTQTPDRQVLIPFVQKGIVGLRIESIGTLRIYGRRIGAKSPTWSEEINLEAPQLNNELKQALSQQARKEQDKKSHLNNFNVIAESHLTKLEHLAQKSWVRFQHLEGIEKFVLIFSVFAFIIFVNLMWETFQKIENAKYASTNRYKQSLSSSFQRADELRMESALLDTDDRARQEIKIKEACQEYFKNLDELKPFYKSEYLEETCKNHK